MQVSRLGNDLVVHLSTEIVEMLHLKEGDSIEIASLDRYSFKLERRMTREEAQKTLDELSVSLPADYKFDREELHEREGMKRWNTRENTDR